MQLRAAHLPNKKKKGSISAIACVGVGTLNLAFLGLCSAMTTSGLFGAPPCRGADAMISRRKLMQTERNVGVRRRRSWHRCLTPQWSVSMSDDTSCGRRIQVMQTTKLCGAPPCRGVMIRRRKLMQRELNVGVMRRRSWHSEPRCLTPQWSVRTSDDTWCGRRIQVMQTTKPRRQPG